MATKESNETQSEICEHGCYEGACNPEPFDRTIFIVLIILGVVFLIVLVALIYDRFAK